MAGPDDWKSEFFKQTGERPDHLGIKTEEQANQALLRQQQAQHMNYGGLAPVAGDQGDGGSINESITPTK